MDCSQIRSRVVATRPILIDVFKEKFVLPAPNPSAAFIERTGGEKVGGGYLLSDNRCLRDRWLREERTRGLFQDDGPGQRAAQEGAIPCSHECGTSL